MEPTSTLIGVPKSVTLWPIIVQALAAILLVGMKIQEGWGTWDVMGKAIAIFLLLAIVGLPAVVMRGRRSGKGVRLSDLTAFAYIAIWATAVLFTHHSR